MYNINRNICLFSSNIKMMLPQHFLKVRFEWFYEWPLLLTRLSALTFDLNKCFDFDLQWPLQLQTWHFRHQFQKQFYIYRYNWLYQYPLNLSMTWYSWPKSLYYWEIVSNWVLTNTVTKIHLSRLIIFRIILKFWQFKELSALVCKNNTYQ